MRNNTFPEIIQTIIESNKNVSPTQHLIKESETKNTPKKAYEASILHKKVYLSNIIFFCITSSPASKSAIEALAPDKKTMSHPQ